LSGSVDVAPRLGSYPVFTVLFFFVGVVICGLIQPTVKFDIELFGDFGASVVRTNRYVILTHTLIVSVIEVIFGQRDPLAGATALDGLSPRLDGA
jgi:hypothetical protein